MKALARRAALACAVAVTALGTLIGPASPASAAPASLTIPAGGSKTVEQSVDAPFLPPATDVVLVIDRTGSMAPAVGVLKRQIGHVMATLQSSWPDVRVGVVAYCDRDEQPFRLASQLGTSPTGAVAGLPMCHGGDLPEAQLDALWRIGGSGGAIAWRPGSNRIVAWVGDAPGHAVSGGHTEAGAIRSLRAVGARVVALSVGRDQLDSSGQASRIAGATGGKLLRGVSNGGVASRLLAGITSLDMTVAANADCDPGLTVRFAPAEKRVVGGSTAVFKETVEVAKDATPGKVLTCRIPFTIAGRDAGQTYTQTLKVTVGKEAEEPPPTDPPSDPPSETPTDPPSETPSETPTDLPSETPSETPAESPSPSDSPTPSDSATPSEPSSSEPSSPPPDQSSAPPSESASESTGPSGGESASLADGSSPNGPVPSS